MGKLGYNKMKKDKLQRRIDRAQKWDSMSTSSKIFAILGMMASPFILLFLLIYIIYRIDTGVPYTFKVTNRLENPNVFNMDFFYSEIDSIYEYQYAEDIAFINAEAMELFEDTGLQLYIIGLYAEPSYKSLKDFENKCKEYIDNNIKDEYGIYLLFSDYREGDEEIIDMVNGYFLYTGGEEFILGSEASKFFNSAVWKTYSAASNKVRYHTVGYYNSLEEFFMIMDYVIDRNLHPYRSFIITIIKNMIPVCAIVVIINVIRKRREKKRIQAILNSNLDELSREHEELYSKYDINEEER